MRVRSVFITGGSSGLGKALAELYGQKGWRVGVCARRLQPLQEMKNRLGAEIFQADVANKGDIARAVNEFAEDGLDLVIANAGKSYENKKRIPDFEVGRQLVMVNLIGVMNTFEPAMKRMLGRQGGHLAAVASIAGLNGFPGVSAYSASKGGVINLCESLSLDLAKENIAVSAVCPGFIDTPLTQKNPHPMPFMVSAPKAAEAIYRGLEKRKMRIYFPFFFTLVARILALLPRRIYAKIMGIKKLNYSRG